MNEFTNQQEYNDKEAQVANLAINYAKTGIGYYQMRDAFNELCEKSGANRGIDHDSTIGRRTLLVQSVCIKTIHALPNEAVNRLERELKEIANDYTNERERHRPAWRR